MGVAHVTVAVDEDTPLRSMPYLSRVSGAPVAHLDIGHQVAVYGSSVALRRLAREADRAAEDAARLAEAELATAGGDPR